jgi:hypothetical protein
LILKRLGVSVLVMVAFLAGVLVSEHISEHTAARRCVQAFHRAAPEYSPTRSGTGGPAPAGATLSTSDCTVTFGTSAGTSNPVTTNVSEQINH